MTTIRLWPDGPPSLLAGVGEEVAYTVPVGVAKGTTFYRNISDPTLTVHAPTVAGNGAGVIVVPGGGWVLNAHSHEGVQVAEWLTGLGYAAFVLKYRVQGSVADQDAFDAREAKSEGLTNRLLAQGLLPAAISDLVTAPEHIAARAAAAEDGRRAIAIAREQATSLGVDAATLGMLGFSAGAFLTVDIAMDPQAEQLAWIAPIYGGETRGNPVPSDAPPMFSAVAQNDILFKICEGLHRDWCDAGRSSEHHVFARGAHGFGMVRQDLPSDRWTDLFVAWLDDLRVN